MIKNTLLERAGLASLALGLAFASAPAFAQQTAAAADAAEETIVVTGSRIARADLEAASPVTIIGESEFQLRQPVNAEALLRTIPGIRPGIGAGVNNGNNGSATVDLRGLGTNRTLVLMDGRRIVPFGLDAVVDTNVIPVALISRVDVLTGGASTVYGADAVSGVVNFIMKRDFSGVNGGVTYGLTERGDAQNFRADLTIGGNFDEGRGNAVLSMSYTNTEALNQNRRTFGEFARATANGLPQGSNTGVPVFFTGPTIPGVTDPTFGAVLDVGTGAFRAPGQADLFNFNPFNYYQVPQDRYQMFASARYEITPAIEAYSSGLFVVSKIKTNSAPSGTFLLPFNIPVSNPFLPVAARNQLCGASGISTERCDLAAVTTDRNSPNYIEIASTPGRRFVEFPDRQQNYESTTFQLQFGLRGTVFEDLKWDISAQYGETNQNQSRFNWGSRSRVNQALRAVNTTTCSDTSNGCVPLNLFGPAGSITPAMINFINLDSFVRRNVQQTVIVGTLGGDLKGLQSPFASSPVAFSVGGEYRRLASIAIPDSAASIQSEVLGTGARTPTDKGAFSVAEVFGEIAIPLIEDKPFFDNLTAEGGIRYADYTTTGTNTTWKGGLSWTPTKGVKFRSMYQLAIRAPNIAELFAGEVQGLSNQAEDPCQGAVGTSTAARRALCLATGVPSSSIGSVPTPSAGQINATTSGNPNLDVERAKTFTLGTVLTPTFIPGFSFTVDYFNIRVRQAITTPNQADILNGCYSTALNPSQTFNSFCALVGRNPVNGSLNGGGETKGVILGASNLGTLRTRGVDFGLNYKINLEDIGIGSGGAGSFSINNNTTWVLDWNFQATPNAINRDCNGFYSVACLLPRPEVRSLTRFTYSVGPFDVSLLWTYISKVKFEPVAPTPRPPLTTPQTGGPALNTIFDAYEKIPAYNYFDLALAANINDNLRLNLTVNNMFDRQPPVVGAQAAGTTFNSGNTFPQLYDVLGRSYQLGLNLRF